MGIVYNSSGEKYSIPINTTRPLLCGNLYIMQALECFYDRTGCQTHALLSIPFGRVQLFDSTELSSINMIGCLC